MGSKHFVVVAGPTPAALSGTLHDRFEHVRVIASLSHTVIECSISDESALRALVTQLWDAGAEILLVAHVLTDSYRSHHGQAHY